MAFVMAFITIAFVLMVVAWAMMIGLYQRYRLAPSINPLDGPRRWAQFFRGEGFPTEAEPRRKLIARLYIAALISFGVALAAFFAIGGPALLEPSLSPE
jgi:hypothetical protein